MARIHSDQLRDERLIIWVEDMMHAPYVRELLAATVANRAWWPSQADHPGEVVGFATLCAGAPTNGAPRRFTRRIFWLGEDDRKAHRSGRRLGSRIPADAVDPRSVIPRVPGRHPADERTGPPEQERGPILRRLGGTPRTETVWEVVERSDPSIEITKITRRTSGTGPGRVLQRRRFLLRDNCIFTIRSRRQRRSAWDWGPEQLSNFYLTFHRNEVVGLVHGERIPPVSGVVHINHQGRMFEEPFEMGPGELHDNDRFIRALARYAPPRLIFLSRDLGLIRDISLRLADLDL